MNPLRIFLLATLILVVFGIDNAKAIEEKEPEWNYVGEASVNSIAFSGHGEYIVTGSQAPDNTVRLFRNDNSTPIWNYTADGWINEVEISADGNYIAATSGDTHIYFWNIDGSTPVWNFSNGAYFHQLSMSSDGEYIAASDWDGILYLFGKDSGTPIWTYEVGDMMRVEISADGEYIAIASNNHNFYLFSTANSTPLWNYTAENAWEVAISGNGEYIVAAADWDKLYFFHRDSNIPLWNHSIGLWPTLSISDNGDYIVAGDWDSGNISLFGKDSGDPIWQFQYDTPNGCREVSISADGRYIAGSTGPDTSGQAFLWNKNSSVPLWTNYTKENEYIISTQISDDGRYVGIGTQPDGFYLFDNIVLKNWDLEVGARSVSITDDGRLVAIGDGSKVRLVDNSNGTTIWSYETYGAIDNIATSSNGTYIAAGGYDYRVYLFNKESSTPLWYSELDERVLSLDMSADGSYIVACAQNPDRRIYLFSKDSSTPIWTYRTGGNVYDVDISLDGEYIAAISTNDNAVRVFNKESNEPLWTVYMGEQGQVIEMSDDSNYLVVGSGEKVHLFDTLTGELLWDYDIGNKIREIDISSNGSHIIVSGDDSKRYNDKLFLFNKNSSTPLWSHQTEGGDAADPGAEFGDVEISSDGKIIAGISNNGKLYSFSSQSNVPIWSSISSEMGGYLFSMTPDGSSFIGHCMDRSQLCSYTYNFTDSIGQRGGAGTGGTTEEEPIYDISISYYSGSDGQVTVSQTTQVQMRLNITNNGNVVDNLSLHLTNQPSWAELGSETMQIGRGQTQAIIIILSPDSAALSGRDYTFQVVVTSADGSEWISPDMTAVIEVKETEGEEVEVEEVVEEGCMDINATNYNSEAEVDDGSCDYPKAEPEDEPVSELYEGDEAGECSDEADNDKDGLFDCDDDTCAGSPACKANDSGEDDESLLPSVSMIPALISIGLIARYRRK
jgi:WD40 repeat protein